MRRVLPIALLVAIASAVSFTEAAPDGSPQAFLAATFRLSRADMDRIDAGEVVSRTLTTNHSREVATLGIVRITTSPERYVERLEDIAAFKRTDDILQIGTFSDPPQAGDIADLELHEGDVRRIQACRADDCGVQLSAEMIQQFERADWRAADAASRATRLLQQQLVDYVVRYRKTGASALMTYADTSPRLDVRKEFAALVDSDRVTWPHLDALRRHVLDPGDRPGITDVIYWSKERVYKRPVVSVTHVSIMRQADDAPIRYAITSKQIYAMHYFDASLGLTLLVPDGKPSSPATYVVYLNRSRIDLFDGVFGGLVRRIVAGRARSLVGTQLTRLQRTLGAEAGTASGQ